MSIIRILLTLVLFAGVVLAFNKKTNPAITLMMAGILSLLVGGLVNGYNPLGAKTTGFLLFDIFEYFRASSVVDTIARTGVRTMAILAYVAYMDHIKASTLFALVVSKPILNIKNKYILAGAVYLLTILLILVIPNGTGRIALLLGTVYPVMLACGITKATAAVAIFAGAMNGWGPANAKIPVAANFMGIEVNMAEYFLTIEWMWDIAAFAAAIAVFIISSKYFDKKENAEKGEGVFSGVTVESLNVPKWYFVLPMIPIIFIILFSGTIKAFPTLAIETVMFMCFVFVYLLIVLTSKEKLKAWNDGNLFFISQGNTLGRIVSIIIAGSLFGAGITSIGGVNALLQPFLSAEGATTSTALFIIITAIISVAVSVIAVSDYVANSIIGPVYTAYAAATGLNVNGFLLLTVNTYQMGIGYSPATAHVAMVSETAQVPINTIIKRAIAPIAAAIIVYIIGTIVMV